MISIGDSMLDSLLDIHDAEVNCTVHKDRCLLCVNYADKIPAKTLHIKAAGNAANNAVGSSRLGLKTAFYTVLGADSASELIKTALLADKVAPNYIQENPKIRANTSVVVNFKGERTILIFHAKRVYKLPKLAPTKWIYYTSLGKNHAGLNRDIVAHVKKHKIKLGYNPGTYQLRAGTKQMKPVIAVSEVIFVNKEEAALIVGPQFDIRRYLIALHKLGPKAVVITDGGNGSYSFDGENFWQMGILKIPVIEKTGAGDAFATAMIAALHYGRPINEAMCWGTMNSASVIMNYGPQDGLLSRAGVAKFQKKYKHKCAQPF